MKTGDYNGVQLVKRLNQLGDKAKQRAEVSVYFKRFDEAEKAYKDMDRYAKTSPVSSTEKLCITHQRAPTKEACVPRKENC